MALTVYLASGFFRPDEIEILDHLEKLLPTWGVDVYSPRRDSPQLDKDDPESREKTFSANVQAMDNSDVLLTPRIAAPHDDGTMWEMGYACCWDLPIIAYHLPSAPSNFNLMPAFSTDIHCYTEEDLREVLEEWEKSYISISRFNYLTKNFPFKGELY